MMTVMHFTRLRGDGHLSSSHGGWSPWGTHNIGSNSGSGLLVMFLQQSRSPFCHAAKHWTRGTQNTPASSSFLPKFNCTQLQSPPQECSHSVWAFRHSKLLPTSQPYREPYSVPMDTKKEKTAFCLQELPCSLKKSVQQRIWGRTKERSVLPQSGAKPLSMNMSFEG